MELRQRRPPLVIPNLRAAARGMPCTLRVPGLCREIPDDPTVVWCHSNWEDHGKGKGLKAHDCFGCFGCLLCHNWLDRSRAPERRAVFDRARDESLYLLFASGKVKVSA